MQPLGRGWARYFTWLKYKRTPAEVIAAPEEGVTTASHAGGNSRLNFWNETGQGREALLTEIFALLETEGWRYSSDTGWKRWDVQIYGNLWWIILLHSVTEYHGGPKCLTRVRLGYKMVVTTFLVNFIALTALIYRAAFTSNRDLLWWAIYAIFAAVLYSRAWRLKRRVADLVIAAANRCGMERVHGERGKAKAAV